MNDDEYMSHSAFPSELFADNKRLVREKLALNSEVNELKKSLRAKQEIIHRLTSQRDESDRRSMRFEEMARQHLEDRRLLISSNEEVVKKWHDSIKSMESSNQDGKFTQNDIAELIGAAELIRKLIQKHSGLVMTSGIDKPKANGGIGEIYIDHINKIAKLLDVKFLARPTSDVAKEIEEAIEEIIGHDRMNSEYAGKLELKCEVQQEIIEKDDEWIEKIAEITGMNTHEKTRSEIMEDVHSGIVCYVQDYQKYRKNCEELKIKLENVQEKQTKEIERYGRKDEIF